MKCLGLTAMALIILKDIRTLSASRKGGRVVDGAGLENRNTGNGIGGSNPFPSATLFCTEN